MIMPLQGKTPIIAPGAFIAPTATIIGDVEIGEGASVWYGAVVRGDIAPIRIGVNTNIQDNSIVHTDVNYPAIIGDNVTVGHNAIVHGCTVEDKCLIGMGAVVLSGAHLKTCSVIAAGAVVKEGQIAGPYQLLAGMPAVVKKELSDDVLELLDHPINEYRELSDLHREELKR